ncbi:BTB/POZ domain-containing protein 3/6 [Mytilus galloprovincialis]|uniref:BTB/POZ domain-containing protein 3/6 n=2 Tax=Mytilus galloprovincialis TaxID=29158 RepID=A0A8B6DX30_MYTGA|nr:BTB/POZ domain-containing protein 3/6 [Mytilus galloprovincialis]
MAKQMETTTSDNNDWRDDKSVLQCLSYMLKHEIMCDVIFLVGSEKKAIPAHKTILASRSPVFYTMFEGSLPEKGEIAVPDIEENTFRVLLQYIYCDEVNVTSENMQNLLYASDKYMLFKVKSECEQRLKETVTTSDPLKTLQTAMEFSMEELKLESISYIEKNAWKCLFSERALKLSKECVEEILKSDYLSCTETDVCQFILEWSSYQCTRDEKEVIGKNIRSALKDLLFLVRFPLIEKEYFVKNFMPLKILKEEEIICMFTAPFTDESSLFNTIPRTPVSERTLYRLERHRAIDSLRRNTDKIDALGIQVDKPIWFRGVIIYGGYGNQSVSDPPCYIFNMTSSVSLLNSAGETCYESKAPIVAMESSETQDVYINSSFQLKANTSYTLLVKNINFTSYFGKDCKTTCTSNGVTFTFRNSPMCTTGTNTNKGQIAGLLFSI